MPLKLSAQHPAAAIAQAQMGVTLSQQSKYNEAVHAYQRAIAIDPSLPNIYLNLGLAYFKMGDFPHALTAFEKEPPSDKVTTLIGMSHFGMGQYKEAAARLKPLADAQPENTELNYLLAKCYLWSHDNDAAMALFEKLLQRDPESAGVHMLLGEALDFDHRTDEAIKEFETAARNGPNEPEVHFGLGYLYWKQKRYDDAAQEFEREIKGNPKDPLPLAYLGDVQMRAGKSEEAVALLKKARDGNRDLHIAHEDLAILFQQQKQNQLAVAEYREAIRTDASNFDAHYRLARLLKEMGRKTEADKEFAIVQKLHEKKTEEPLMRISGPR